MDRREHTEKMIEAWMAHVFDATEWSADEWAARAKIAPTTITRFFDTKNRRIKKGRPLPSGTTLSKLEAVVAIKMTGEEMVATPTPAESSETVADLVDQLTNLDVRSIRAIREFLVGEKPVRRRARSELFALDKEAADARATLRQRVERAE